jgi:AbrB family looped-hinge helix DNA binding protein
MSKEPRARKSTPPLARETIENGRLDAMRATIDKAGRLVIPLAIRERVGLLPGTEVDVVADDFAVRIVPAVQGARLVREGGRLVARPAAPDDATAPDIAAVVDAERDRWPW